MVFSTKQVFWVSKKNYLNNFSITSDIKLWNVYKKKIILIRKINEKVHQPWKSFVVSFNISTLIRFKRDDAKKEKVFL